MNDYPNPRYLAETDWLAEHLSDGNLRLVDLRGQEAYAAGHIPSAVRLDIFCDLCETPDDPVHQVASPTTFAARVGRFGIGDDTLVVAYDDRNGFYAARLWWCLRYYGHEGVKVLNGGIAKWTREGRPQSREPAAPAAAVFTPRPQPYLLVNKEDVKAAIGRPGVLILDARMRANYTGEERPAPPALDHPGLRRGHIPTSVNAPYDKNAHAETAALRSAAEMRRVFQRAGVNGEVQVIATCAAGVAAAYDMFILNSLGYEKVALYDGSWLEWGADPSCPVEEGPGR